MPAEVSRWRGDEREGARGREKRSYATMPAEVHSRAITDARGAARRGPLNEWLRKPWAL